MLDRRSLQDKRDKIDDQLLVSYLTLMYRLVQPNNSLIENRVRLSHLSCTEETTIGQHRNSHFPETRLVLNYESMSRHVEEHID